MSKHSTDSIAMLTAFLSSDEIERTARQTKFVQRTSKITGKIFLALLTFGTWSDSKTTLAQLASKAKELPDHLKVSPEAIFSE